MIITSLISCKEKPAKFECQYEGEECPNYYKGCTGHTEPVSVQYHKYQDLIMPGYACPDTLIVMDEKTLNERFAKMEQSPDFGTDSDIDQMLHAPNLEGNLVCMNFYQYKEHLLGLGYNDSSATHIAKVDFHLLKPDNLYTSLMED